MTFVKASRSCLDADFKSIQSAATGVDRISVGRLTKDAKAVDYSMRVDG